MTNCEWLMNVDIGIVIIRKSYSDGSDYYELLSFQKPLPKKIMSSSSIELVFGFIESYS